MPDGGSRSRVAWLAVGLALLAGAWFSLNRVRNGELFLFHLPIDRRPLTFELHDAAASAAFWTAPALVFLAISSAALAGAVRVCPWTAVEEICGRVTRMYRSSAILCGFFTLACVTDLISTWLYFRAHRIDDELHPGIKLMTYAYGLSVGCFIGKAIQGLLAVLVCVAFPKGARAILIVLTIAYFAAAVWNTVAV
jgi:hypothetical protein